MLKLRILIAARTGIGDHGGWGTTKATLAEHVWRNRLGGNIETFLKSCLHCLCTTSGDIIPRPLGQSMHGIWPNEVLHFDFCYIMPGGSEKNYVLALKDNFSGYIWLALIVDADTSTVAHEF